MKEQGQIKPWTAWATEDTKIELGQASYFTDGAKTGFSDFLQNSF